MGNEYVKCFSFLSLLLLMVETTTAKKYDKFQSLGFGIYTGEGYGRIDYNTTFQDEVNLLLSKSKDATVRFVTGHPSCRPNYFSLNGTCAQAWFAYNECGCNGVSFTMDKITKKPLIKMEGCEYGLPVLLALDIGHIPYQCYIGNEDPSEDVKGRMRIMEDAVKRAYHLSDKNEGTLKIFNAPEFFWRGRNGAYKVSTITHSDPEQNTINQIGRRLEQLVQNAKYKDWLFIFGTVIASNMETLDSSTNKTYNFYNFAPVYKGFDPETTTSSDGMRFLSPKHYISSIDFLNAVRSTTDVPDPNHFESMYNTEEWSALRGFLEKNEYTMIDENFFSMDGIIFSLEICLDHGEGVAKFNFVKNIISQRLMPAGGDGQLSHTAYSHPQISLVTSAGMSIYPKNLVLLDGGSIFLQDGMRPFVTFDNVQAMLVNVTYDLYSPNGNRREYKESQPKNYDLYDESAEKTMRGLFVASNRQNPKIVVYLPRPIVERLPVQRGKSGKSGKSGKNGKNGKSGKIR